MWALKPVDDDYRLLSGMKHIHSFHIHPYDDTAINRYYLVVH